MDKKLKLIIENCQETEIIKEAYDQSKPRTIKMRGVYMVSDVRNGNNRIYEYETLKPEVDKFIEEKIKTNQALEELEHPECNLTKNFEVLTEHGFEWFENLKVGDMVWTRNPITKNAELKPVKKIISQNYKGNGYIVEGKNIYAEHTANHRMITEDRNGNLVVKTIEEIYNDRKGFHNNYIPKTLDVSESIDSENFTIKGTKSFARKNLLNRHNHTRFEDDLIIDKMTFCKLFGFWLAEGSSHVCRNDDGNITGGTISFVQEYSSNKDICNILDTVFNNLPDVIKNNSGSSIYYRPTDNKPMKHWFINDIRLAEYFNSCGNVYTKRIPKEILKFNKKYLEQLVYFFGLGDGRKTIRHFRKYNNLLLDNIKDIFSTSEGLIDDLSYCILKCGLSTSKRCVVSKNDYMFANHIIKHENKHPLYIASILTSPKVCMDKRTLKITKIDVSEQDNLGAYCIQVDNTSFFMRNRGKCHWTGNCVTINPERVCARTVSLVEDNKSWIGESVVLASDPKFGIIGSPKGDILASLLTFDCAVGHSSRSLGNVDEKTGRVTDLNLICIDTVLSPSVGIFNDSNANRMVKGILESREANKFVNGILESKEFVINTHGQILEEKYQAFERDLNNQPKTYISQKKADFLGAAITKFFNSISK